MELGTTIFGLVLFALCTLPIVLSVAKRNKNNRRILDNLKAFAAEHGCNIDEYELAYRHSVGIDKTQKRLFFCAEAGDSFRHEEVDLTHMKSCAIIKRQHEVQDFGSVINRLALEFSPKNKSTPKTQLEFYDANATSGLLDELQSVGKWHEIVVSVL